MKPNVSQVEAATIQRALAKEEAELPFAVKAKDGLLFCETFRTETSVHASCGCGSEIALVSKNVVVIQVTRCQHHGNRTYTEQYACLGTEPGFAHLKPEAEPHFKAGLHPPLEREETDLVH